ncbi:MAG: hypothetical protein HY319_04975 [Armatimonadetes bacterium]|nr:hypothetical protein [Armatimonadota bacterium]
MQIPRERFEVKGLKLEGGRLQAPDQAGADVKDLVELANRELELNDRILAEARQLDQSARDQDPRPGAVALTGGVAGCDFANLRADLAGPSFEATARGRNDAVLECRKNAGNEIRCDSNYGFPGAVPGFSFRVSPEYGQPTLQLDGNFSRSEMVYRLSKDDLLNALQNVPADAEVPKQLLAEKLQRASGTDFISLQRELSQTTRDSLESQLGVLNAASPFLGVLGLGCAALASAGYAGVAVGLFVSGLVGGYAAIKIGEHQGQKAMDASFGLDKLGGWLEKNATELPAASAP